MRSLEDIQAAALVEGLRPGCPVTVIAATWAYSVKYDLWPPEHHFYDEVTDYVRRGVDWAEQIEQKHRHSLVVGFALSAQQCRLASSPQAIHCSLRRGHERLRKRLEEMDAVATEGGSPIRSSADCPTMSWLLRRFGCIPPPGPDRCLPPLESGGPQHPGGGFMRVLDRIEEHRKALGGQGFALEALLRVPNYVGASRIR